MMLKKKNIFLIWLFILLGSSVYLSYKYYNNIKFKTTFLDEASVLDILTEENIISYQTLTEEKEELENKLISGYNSTNLEVIEEELESIRTSITSLNEEIKAMEEEYNELSYTNEQLTSELKNLKEEQKEEQSFTVYSYAPTVTEDVYQIANVPTYNQFPLYPAGCESVSLYILLKYYGTNVSVSDIVDRLPKGGWLHDRGDGVIVGGNPTRQFVGTPELAESFGVFEAPIIDVANQFKSGIINGTGASLDEVLEIVSQGRPVMAWTTISLLSPYLVTSWIDEVTGETLNWYANEHAVVIIGYSASTVIISDPYSGTIKSQNRSTFESRYNFFGKRNVYY